MVNEDFMDRNDERLVAWCDQVREYITKHAGIDPGYDVNCEGFVNHQFGVKCGPCYKVSSYLHELAHCAQLSDGEIRRVDPYGWGFRYRDEPYTTRASEREAEVFAIEAILTNAIFGTDVEEVLQANMHLVYHMQDYFVVPCQGDALEERKESRKAWFLDQMRSYLKDWDVTRALERLSTNLRKIRRRAKASPKTSFSS